ncbi:MAG TPA: acyl carrier protein [Spirochaetia bacterium]|nr:acyl carrier protein [Spirochaetia bacterium]
MMQSANVSDEVRRIMSSVSRFDISSLESDIRFREELGVDSLMAMEIIAYCEKELSIQLDEGNLGCVETIGDFVEYVNDVFRKTHGPDKA